MMSSLSLCTPLLLLAGIGAKGEDPQKQSASHHDKVAAEAYDLGKFSEAIRNWEIAFSKTEDAVFLLRVGQVHLSAGRCREAKGFFERSIPKLKMARQKAQAIKLVGVAEKDCKENQRPPQKIPVGQVQPGGPKIDSELPNVASSNASPTDGAQPSVSMTKGAKLMPYAWSSWALGAAAVATGAALIAIHSPPIIDGVRQPRMRLSRTPGIIAASGGGALLLLGTIFWLADSGPAESSSSAGVFPTPGGAVLSFGGAW